MTVVSLLLLSFLLLAACASAHADTLFYYRVTESPLSDRRLWELKRNIERSLERTKALALETETSSDGDQMALHQAIALNIAVVIEELNARSVWHEICKNHEALLDNPCISIEGVDGDSEHCRVVYLCDAEEQKKRIANV
jgi:hypothetical protein